MRKYLSEIFNRASLWGYLIELVIVILGVSVAFWLSTVAESSKEKKLKESYLQEILSDLQTDIRGLDKVIEFNRFKVELMERGIGQYSDAETNKDSILFYATQVGNYNFFDPSDITYRTMITSGDFKLIADPEIKKGMVRLYGLYDQIGELQEKFLEALDQNYFPFLVEKVDYIEMRALDPEFHKRVRVKNYMVYALNDTNVHIAYYEAAKKLASKLSDQIQTNID